MKDSKFVVAHFSLFEGRLDQELVFASSRFEAAKKFLQWEGPEKDLLSLQAALGEDQWINILPLDTPKEFAMDTLNGIRGIFAH